MIDGVSKCGKMVVNTHLYTYFGVNLIILAEECKDKQRNRKEFGSAWFFCNKERERKRKHTHPHKSSHEQSKFRDPLHHLFLFFFVIFF